MNKKPKIITVSKKNNAELTNKLTELFCKQDPENNEDGVTSVKLIFGWRPNENINTDQKTK